MKSKNTFFRALVGALCLINLASFLVYYFTTFIFVGEVSTYIFYFYTEIVRTTVPIISALAIFVTYAKSSVGKSLLYTVFFTLPWLIYLFPYNAYKYAYGGLVIEEVLLYASLETLFVLAMLFLVTLLLALIMIATSYASIKLKKKPFNRAAILSGSDPLDFSTPSAIGIFSGCSVIFLYNLVNEIVDTVQFIEYANGVYQNSEIIYIIIKYVFILGMLLFSYFTAHKLKKSMKQDFGN